MLHIRKITIVIGIVCGHAIYGKLQSPEELEKALKEFENVEVPKPVNTNAFGIGEYLDFGIYVALPGVGQLPVMGGHGILEVPNVVWRKGSMCYWLKSCSFSTGIVGQIYPVNDIIESFLDVDSFYSLQFRKDVSEGRFREKYEMEFDQINHRAVRHGRFDVPTYPKAQDILSAFYYVRTLEFEPDDTIPLPFHDNGGNYPILVVVHARETVEVPAGKFSCLVVEPIIKVEGLFQRKGRMWVWLTDDYRKMPVKMVSEIPIGKVQAVLLEFREGNREWR